VRVILGSNILEEAETVDWTLERRGRGLIGLSAILFDASSTIGSSSGASTSEFRRLRVIGGCFDGKREDALGLYLGSEVARLSRGLIAETVPFETARDEGLRAEGGDGVELSAFADCVALEATMGDLSLLLSVGDDSFAAPLFVTFAAGNAVGGERLDSFAFSLLLPKTSAIAFETDNCPNECLTPDGLGIPGFLEILDDSGAEVDIVPSKQEVPTRTINTRPPGAWWTSQPRLATWKYKKKNG